MIDPHEGWNTNIKPPIIGFLISIGWIFFAYFLTLIEGYLTRRDFQLSVLGIAVIHAMTQFVFFFHLGKEEKPRWNMMIFLFMVLVIFVLVGGSLWIMRNLNYNVMPGMHGNS